jgi:Domain of unknown function (DUF4169)
MAEIINLRTARKRRERSEKETLAANNRASFGRTKSEKQLSKAEQSLATKRLDDHKRDDERS